MNETLYFLYRKWKGVLYETLFFICRIFPIKNNKIVVCCFNGEMGYGCSPKYIIENLLADRGADYEIIWLVNDTNKGFPSGIKKVKNNKLLSAYHLSTAKIWVDNAKKELGVIKRKNQIYINTWHGPIGFKTCGALRKEKRSLVGELISRRDCAMTDYYLSNSDWCTNIHTRAFPYDKNIVYKVGTPRTDPLLDNTKKYKNMICKKYNISNDSHVLIFAPTFRGGIQKNKLEYNMNATSLDMKMVLELLEKKFGGSWYIMLRLHPHIASYMRTFPMIKNSNKIIDISQEDDLYALLAGADVLITDFSSCAFDAAYKRIPVFIYADDFDDFIDYRDLYWRIEDIPFSISKNNDELKNNILNFDHDQYQKKLEALFQKVGLIEPGNASKWVGDLIRNIVKNECF